MLIKEITSLNEAAKGVNDLLGPDGEPIVRVTIQDPGHHFILEVKVKGVWKYAGERLADVAFNNEKLMPPYKLFAWHSDLDESIAEGFGPFLYDITMEFATLKGGYMTSHALINRLMKRHLDPDFSGNKGHAGGDPTDEAESVYKYYFYNRPDVDHDMPRGFLDLQDKPWMNFIYRKAPTNLKAMIDLNKKGKVVLVDGMKKPILNIS